MRGKKTFFFGEDSKGKIGGRDSMDVWIQTASAELEASDE